MKLRRESRHVVDDDDGRAQVARQALQQPAVGVEPTGRPTHADHGEIMATVIQGGSPRHGSETLAQTDTASWGDIPMVNVSIKLSSLYARFDPMARDATTEAVIARVLPIVRSAKEKGFIVNFDMEQNDFRDVTFHIFRTMFLMDEFRTWDNAGIVCQAYLKSAEADLLELRDYAVERGTAFWVRLVKGAYWDYETIISAQRGHPCPVWPFKPLTDACFERCEDFLIENWMHLRPAIASHNVRSQARAQAKAKANTIASEAREAAKSKAAGERAAVFHKPNAPLHCEYGR
mgnify:CR=1 FL=1